jgi:hypothetical protein
MLGQEGSTPTVEPQVKPLYDFVIEDETLKPTPKQIEHQRDLRNSDPTLSNTIFDPEANEPEGNKAA